MWKHDSLTELIVRIAIKPQNKKLSWDQKVIVLPTATEEASQSSWLWHVHVQSMVIHTNAVVGAVGGWRKRLGRWRTCHARAISTHRFAPSIVPPDSVTQGDNDHRLVFCVLGATIMIVTWQSNFSPPRCFPAPAHQELYGSYGGCGAQTLLESWFNADSFNAPTLLLLRIASTCGCGVNSNQWPVSLWISGITCWKTDLGTNLMGWCVTPAKMLPVTPKNVRAVDSPPLSLLLPCFSSQLRIRPPWFLPVNLYLHIFPVPLICFLWIKSYRTWKFSV